MADPRPPEAPDGSSPAPLRSASLLGGGLVLLAAVALLPGAAAAQERSVPDVIASDRPGLGDGTHVLAPGLWQVELGGTVRSSGADEFSTGEGLIRIGLAPLELRVFVPTLALARGEEDAELGDVGVGVKVPLSVNAGWVWALGGAVTLPTGSDTFTADDPTASASILTETALSESVGFALNVGYGAAFDDLGDGTVSIIATPGFTLGEGFGAYAGYAGFFSDALDQHVLEAGLTRTVAGDTQWDLNAGYDVESEEWFLGVGLARRWR